MTSNYIASARDALATPLTSWNKASNAFDKQASGLGAIAKEHEIKSTDTFAPILGKDKVNPRSTASVELFTMLKEVLVETCLLKPEQALVNFDLDAYRKKLGLTLKEKAFSVAYQKKSQGKSAAIQKLGSKMRDFRNVIITAENVDKPKAEPKTPIVSARDNIKRVYNILNDETKLSDGDYRSSVKVDRVDMLKAIQLLYSNLGGHGLLETQD